MEVSVGQTKVGMEKEILEVIAGSLQLAIGG
jgi:hypothetical protein